MKLGQHSSQCKSWHPQSSQEQREHFSVTPYCRNVEANVSSQTSSAGAPPTPVSSTTFLDSALSQNTNLDSETTVWKYIQDLTVEDVLKAVPPRVVQTIHSTVKAYFQDCCDVALGKICDDSSDELA